MEKRIDVGLLLSFYGPMLTGRQLAILRLYYEDDLSLSEIASLHGMTRQGAYDLIRRGERQLLTLESKLALRERWFRVIEGLGNVKEALAAEDAAKALAIIGDLLRAEEDQDGV